MEGSRKPNIPPGSRDYIGETASSKGVYADGQHGVQKIFTRPTQSVQICTALH